MPSAVLNSASGFTFSPLPNVINQDILISLPTYMRLSNLDIGEGVNGLPMNRLFLKLKS